MNNKKNLVSSLVFQGATILQGLILPRLIIGAFGSNVNGLISSITQFLSFISLLEGGLGAVVLAELYGPIQKRNTDYIKRVLDACQDFFSKLALVFLGYTAVLSIVYPLWFAKEKSFAFVSTLVWILSIGTLAQYLFSITYKLYLQANQKLYIVNIISTMTIVINTVSAIVIINIYPEIHAIKLFSGMVFLLQPMLIRRFIDPEYRKRERKKVNDASILRNRWSGFAQNLAHFINMNTDIALITFFLGLENVSIYSVYMLAINALRAIVSNAGNSYQSALGKYYAENNSMNLAIKFKKFEGYFWMIGITLFSTCLLLINSFVKIYVEGVSDIEYVKPLFALIMVSANMIYVIREPYRLLILAAGKFKETNNGAMIEAILNIVISFLLIQKLGLIGVAIGTLVALIYRFVYFIVYLHGDILERGYSDYIPYIITLFIMGSVNFILYKKVSMLSLSVVGFLGMGVVTVLFEAVFYIICIKSIKYCVEKILNQRI